MDVLAKAATTDLLRELTRRAKCDEKKTVNRTIFVGPPGI